MGPYLQNKEVGVTGKLAWPLNAGLLNSQQPTLLKHTEVSRSFQKKVSSYRLLWPDFSSQKSASQNPNQTFPGLCRSACKFHPFEWEPKEDMNMWETPNQNCASAF